MDTKATINEDVLNNIGTIEVVVLRCQDDPKNAPVNPFDFPKLPVLVEPVPVVSNTKSNPRPDRKTASKKSKEKEPSDDGSGGGMFGLFDGAGDCPTGLDGQYDTREYRSHREDDRSHRGSDRHRRHESPRRTRNPRERILEMAIPRTATPTDEERWPKVRTDKSVQFDSPLATHSRKPPSDSIRRPSGSHHSRHGRNEPHPHLLRRPSPSPERKPTREYPRRPDREERRRNSPVRIYHVLDDCDKHPRGQRRSGESIHEGSRSTSRSTLRGRGRIGSPDRRPRQSGGSTRDCSLSWSSDERRGRDRHYVERERRQSGGSTRDRSWSWNSDEGRGRDRGYDKHERRQRRSSQKRQKHRDRSDDDKLADFPTSFKGLGEDPSRKESKSRRERAPSPSRSDSV